MFTMFVTLNVSYQALSILNHIKNYKKSIKNQIIGYDV